MEAEGEDMMRGLLGWGGGFSREKCSSRLCHMALTVLGLAVGVPTPQPTAHPCSPPRDSRQPGQGTPEPAWESVPLPLSQVPRQGSGWSSAAPEPQGSLSYKMQRTRKLKQEKQLAGPQGSWGSHGKTTRPE